LTKIREDPYSFEMRHVARSSGLVPLAGLALLTLLACACESPKTFATTMEVLQVERFKDDSGQVVKLGLELRYAECPGDARRVINADKTFATCSGGLKVGDKLKTELLSTWQSDKGSYRSDIVKLGDCAMKQDPKDEANYEVVNTCTDVVASGAVVGVRCDRTRSKELVDKCPWLRRK
jgi:hypothetical protein